mmetsp:Transcript_75961/g.210941  ORF Transcript_75961/g.210941 Transcript_75961/m.210941 type:complete len:772 (-) Transcript_75961:150-2465(-)
MSVIFATEYLKTRPGEKLFVVGSHSSLGNWQTALAFPLETTAERFPVWESDAVTLPAGQAVEYKYIVMRENRCGSVLWEELPGNRTVTAQLGAVVTARSVWSNPKCDMQVASEDQERGFPRQISGRRLSANAAAEKRRLQEDVLLRMAESGVSAAAAEVSEAQPLAEFLSQREERRRNFSQSLFDSIPLMPLEGGMEFPLQLPNKLPLEVEQTPEQVHEEPPSQPLRGVDLQRISSFSALTELLPIEEKKEARKGKKAHSHYDPYNLDVPVVIVTSEVAPWSKTGGLGLVAASYSYEFPRNGHRTMLVSPKYRHFDGIHYVGEARVLVNRREEVVKYWHKYVDHGDGKGCDMIFVDHPAIERAGGLYNGDDGREYGDNLFRFTLLCLAAMEAPLQLRLNGREPYGDKVVFLANDWQAGLVPVYMVYKYRRNGCYVNSRVIYVVHNLGYQGMYHDCKAADYFGIEHQAACDLSHGRGLNLCKGALICADRVLTVSPNYAREIQTPAGGFNLQDFVRAKAQVCRLAGILNGIDDCWNPETDHDIHVNYSLDDFEEGKRENKLYLQRQLGLDEDPDVVLLGFVGRLTWQKGVDVLGSIIGWLMDDTGNGVTGHAQLIMMGNGDKANTETLRWAEAAYPGRVCGYVGFDPKVEHQMMAGCDLFVMPSRYEPCGLPQMYSQQYGTLPIVTATGGLVDSVTDVAEGVDRATGFLVPRLAADQLKQVVYKAAELYLKRPLDFRRMQETGISKDFYWPQAMDEYERQIDHTLYDPPTVR